MYSKCISLIENHDKAYHIWKKNKLSQTTLVHFDAHIDLKKTNGNEINIGNYIYPSIRNSIINKFYWIIPGNRDNFYRNFLKIYKIINNFKNQGCLISEIICFPYGFQFLFHGVPIYIYTLDSFPEIRDDCLIDIDTDFFVIENINNAKNTDCIAKRKCWIDIAEFVNIVKNKIKSVKYYTIAYSVNGGFTPLKYKTIGDELAIKFGYNPNKLRRNLKAGKLYTKSLENLSKNSLIEAKKNLDETFFLNPKYYCMEDTYGFLFLENKDYKNALREFNKMLLVNNEDIFCLLGCGIVNFLLKKYSKAIKYFQKVYKIRKNGEALIFLSYIFLLREEYSKARMILKTYSRYKTSDFYYHYIKALIFEKEHQFSLSQKEFSYAMNFKLPDNRMLNFLFDNI